MSERALTVKDVAALYRVTSARVYDWIKGGHIRPLRLPGGEYRFRPEHLAEFDQRCRVGSLTDQTTGSDSEGIAGTWIGRTNLVDIRDPYQRGRQTAKPQKGGGTNG